MKIQVRATKRGFLDGTLREEGAEFMIDDKQFAKEWMVKLGAKPEAPAKPADKKQEKEPI
jgi:hypothetical protein